ncbi:hypothetical protein LCGC14_0764720 [marine sediment metagenome]|uniref:Terminase large subunit gp17-like C-terminal domain-containing protein n=1 Tax=marine sediment metagenome TaxID=412755 RepID=A0A0F9Q4C0_9ZZZZ
MTYYGFVAWKLFCIDDLPGLFPEILYLSYQDKLAGVHVRNAQRLIDINPYFSHMTNISKAESIIKYSVGAKTFTVTPTGILAFKRGRHTIGILSDDILQDPQAAKMDYAQIEKITIAYLEQVVGIKKKGGFNHLIGTSQDKKDLFFQLKANKNFNWKMNRAILSFKKKQALWPEMHTYDELIDLRDNTIGSKAFSKEYLCEPVRSAEAFFTQEQIDNIHSNRYNVDINKYETDNRVIAAADIGKKRHPSHVVVFELIERKNKKPRLKQLISKYLEGWGYIRQKEYFEELIKKLGIEVFPFDNTRGEFETFIENRTIPPEMIPCTFTTKFKATCAGSFEIAVDSQRIDLVQDKRQAEQILSVDNDLDAPSTSLGHGDAFFSNMMAAKYADQKEPGIRDSDDEEEDAEGNEQSTQQTQEPNWPLDDDD